MTIDDAIDIEINFSTTELKEYHSKLAEWLEELKELKNGSIPIIHGKAELEEHDKQIRADAIKDTELFREIFLEDLINQSVDREEAIMYRNICEMSWSKYLEQIKEQNND